MVNQHNSRTLICITTCNRLLYLKWLLPDYLAFVQSHSNFDLIVALDGHDEDYIAFCNAHGVPLIYSELREGVGISKNRVLEHFNNYQHYFYIDDDAELLEPNIFHEIINISKETGIPHFSQGGGFGFKEELGRLSGFKYEIIQSKYGSGQFSYFDGEALRKVGGWHTLFAEFKRGGHTEHSYRFYNAGLSPAPFHHIPALNDGYMNWHQPEHVTILKNVATSKNSRLKAEEDLIQQKLSFYPAKSLSPFHVLSKSDWESTFTYKPEFISDTVTKIIFNPFLEEHEKANLFKLMLKIKEETIISLNQCLEQTRYDLHLYRNSKSYQLGHMLLRPFKFVTKLGRK